MAKNTIKQSGSPKQRLRTVKETYTQEVVFALCGPIGSPIHETAEELKQILKDSYNYECTILKLSDYIRKHTKNNTEILSIIKDKFKNTDLFKTGEIRNDTAFNITTDLIDAGNALREKYGESVLADLAISDIAMKREEARNKSGKKYFQGIRACYIIDSIKNQNELIALKEVYRDILYVIGVFSDLDEREKTLKNKMKSTELAQLIDRDSGEELKSGQTVRETFPNADFFLKADNGVKDEIAKKLHRFLDIIFNVSVQSPTKHETAMYMASSAAKNSACLSRQVGAAVTDKDGQIISLGWNDVPKAGGGLYQQDNTTTNTDDLRCMRKGAICRNDEEKRLIAGAISDKLIKENLIHKSKKDEVTKVILSSKVGDLIEFSRAIHAEMHALIVGGQIAGDHIRDGKLYSTTYPCHNCARHIVASGIKQVFYIEPYRKSLATKLHDDSISEKRDDKKVQILAFEGVAPTRYLKLFQFEYNSRKRKDENGNLIKIDRKNAVPIYEVSLESVPALEGLRHQRLVNEGLIKSTLSS